MDFPTIVGIAASIFTSTCLIPQIVKIVKEKRAEDISFITLSGLFVGHCLWIVYGVMQKDAIIIVSNGFAACIDIVTFVLVRRYNK